jgi:hypothetical protein
MSTIKFNVLCSACNHTGIYSYRTIDGQTVTENPCPFCNGTGNAPLSSGMESAYFDSLSDDIDKIKKKVDKIWDKINV